MLYLDAFKIYGKKNFEYIKQLIEEVRSKRDGIKSKPTLRKSYDSQVGVFPCRSFNLGSQSVSYPHVDEQNLAQSWCSITPLGSFNPDLGGHLVLWNFRLVIKFPPGSTILIPSALLCHSNTPIQPGEERHSIVQYVAGGIARWVDNNHMLEEDWRAQATFDEIQQKESEQKIRWKNAVDKYTKLEELYGLY